MKDKNVIRSSQQVMLDQLDRHDEMTAVVHEGKAVDIVCLSLLKAFDMQSSISSSQRS